MVEVADPMGMLEGLMPTIRSVARRTSPGPRFDDDNLSDAQMAAVELAREFDPNRGVPFSAYLRTLLPLRLIDKRRRRTNDRRVRVRATTTDFSAVRREDQEALDSKTSYEQEWVVDEEDEMTELVRPLRFQDRKVVTWWAQGVGTEEMARRIGRSRQMVYHMVHYALAELREFHRRSE